MLASESSQPSADRTPGRLSKALRRMLMKQATVVAAEQIADQFRLITLESPAFKDVAWMPGRKVQIAMGSAFVARTYTPIEWNVSTGRTCILGYAHGEGPGSAWVRNTEPGAACDIFGPRASLDTSRMAGPLAVFGDETSIGIAYALVQHDRARPGTCHFEVGDVASTRHVLAQLGLGDAAVYARTEVDAHLEEMEAALPTLAAAGASFVLTGRAGAIQRLLGNLKRRSVPAARIAAKAYWAPGKRGLD